MANIALFAPMAGAKSSATPIAKISDFPARRAWSFKRGTKTKRFSD